MTYSSVKLEAQCEARRLTSWPCTQCWPCASAAPHRECTYFKTDGPHKGFVPYTKSYILHLPNKLPIIWPFRILIIHRVRTKQQSCMSATDLRVQTQPQRSTSDWFSLFEPTSNHRRRTALHARTLPPSQAAACVLYGEFRFDDCDTTSRARRSSTAWSFWPPVAQHKSVSCQHSGRPACRQCSTVCATFGTKPVGFSTVRRTHWVVGLFFLSTSRFVLFWIFKTCYRKDGPKTRWELILVQ